MFAEGGESARRRLRLMNGWRDGAGIEKTKSCRNFADNQSTDGCAVAARTSKGTGMSNCPSVTAGEYRFSGTVANIGRGRFAVSKRIVDIVLGTIALILSLPVMGLCCLIIKLSDRGPTIYSQIRVGKDGRLFRMYKLRTMVHDAETESGPVWARDDDPRVLGACRWMRRSHIDELPQLLNVIKGEMSLIGPRPERPEILADLEKTYPEIGRRLAVLTGITVLAQIRNGYDQTLESVRFKLEADLEYIATRRWSRELVILAATLPKFYDRTAH